MIIAGLLEKKKPAQMMLAGWKLANKKRSWHGNPCHAMTFILIWNILFQPFGINSIGNIEADLKPK